MPIYEYKCTQCGAIEEAIQKFSDRPLTTCSKCSGKLQKLISQSTFHLKGSGWYVTDYANKPKDTSGSKDASESKEPKESPAPAASAASSDKTD
jgi:putative FmdB family regulatory protein